METPPLVRCKQGHTVFKSPGRKVEYYGGRSVQGQNLSHRVDPTPDGHPNDLPEARTALHRPVLIGPEQPHPSILHTRLRSKGLGVRRLVCQLDRHVSIRLPTNLPSTKGTVKGRDKMLQSNTHSPILASATLVPETGPTIDPQRADLLTQPRSQILHPGVEQQSLRSAGLFANTAALASHGRRTST